MRSGALKRAQARYRKKYDKSGAIKGYYLKCHTINDADIIKTLDNKTNKNGYVKALIRKDINGGEL